MDIGSTGNKRVFQRLGPANNKFQNQQQTHQHQQQPQKQNVCYHWLAGRCTRSPCPFFHGEIPGSSSNGGATTSSKRQYSSRGGSDEGFLIRKNPNFNNTWGKVAGSNGIRGGGGGGGSAVRKMEKVCNYWIQGTCSFGERCKFLHAWSVGDNFSLLTTLEGHQKGVTGIALPSGSDKLYTGGKDGSVRLWDCQSGQCTGVVNLGAEVGCVISEGPWVFVGLMNMVKAWNSQTGIDLSLSGPVGQVYALVVGNDLLFAGTQDGAILAWKFNVATNCFEPAASLKGHTLAVVTLVVGANRLYSVRWTVLLEFGALKHCNACSH
ncbi:hypothetical protein Nepgr_010887 [Nepenthes gracilis]|uniref:C3H1-type domain-containing protein n=1 Tax=Nepenthes gracilis TaxID=150966 RepID=A0AAD3SE97_NEPGR|nr:hypothetical protein Nepgr_010887 [Nepenthes gracilis]